MATKTKTRPVLMSKKEDMKDEVVDIAEEDHQDEDAPPVKRGRGRPPKAKTASQKPALKEKKGEDIKEQQDRDEPPAKRGRGRPPKKAKVSKKAVPKGRAASGSQRPPEKEDVDDDEEDVEESE